MKDLLFGKAQMPKEAVDLVKAVDQVEGLSDAERTAYHGIYGTLLAITKRPVSQMEVEEQLRGDVAAGAHDSEAFRAAAERLNGFRHYLPVILMVALILFVLRDEVSALAAWGTWRLPFVLITGLVLVVTFIQTRSERSAALRYATMRGWTL